MPSTQDKEIQQYRDLMAVPSTFEEGFNLKMVFAALFLGFVMLPGTIYLTLVMGTSQGAAARWVTVILFAEVARRSMKSMTQQEVFILFYMAGITLGGFMYGGVFMQLLWNQYLVQSTATTSFGIDVPFWAAPSAEVIKRDGPTLFTRDWVVPIFFMAGMLIVSRVDQFGLGYVLYRWTSHVEKLPFPMAPQEGLGMTALVESRDEKDRWRWRCFSIGGVLGLGFGFLYVGVPAITGAFFAAPVQIIPIPWLDMTDVVSTKEFLPAMPLNLVFDITFLLVGMVLPFWAVVGGFIGLLITLVLNPMLYEHGLLTTWTPGMNMVRTLFSNHVDFYLSFGVGLALTIFVVSVAQTLRPLVARTFRSAEPDPAEPRQSFGQNIRDLVVRNRQRGDLSIFVALGIYVGIVLVYIRICMWMMPGDPDTGVGRFPATFFLCFAFIYQPLMGYVNAKLEGLVGQTVQIPLVREAAYILSGYTGSTIWFAPIPLNDYAISARGFRVMELTGTRLTSVIKAEILIVPVVIVSTVLFSHFIWQLAPIPSPAYPFAHEYWEFTAMQFSLQATATLDGSSAFMEAIKPDIIAWGLGGGLIAFIVLSFLGLPTFLVYGVVRGLGQSTPGNVIPELIGALVGRFYFQRKFGHQAYKRYMMIVLAGFGAGMGLIGMASVAVALIAKSTSTLRY